MSGMAVWSVGDVTNALSTGHDWADPALVAKFADQEIDGAALLELTKQDLRQDFGIRELGRVKRILSGIAKLRGTHHHPPQPAQARLSRRANSAAPQPPPTGGRAASGHAPSGRPPARQRGPSSFREGGTTASRHPPSQPCGYRGRANSAAVPPPPPSPPPPNTAPPDASPTAATGGGSGRGSPAGWANPPRDPPVRATPSPTPDPDSYDVAISEEDMKGAVMAKGASGFPGDTPTPPPRPSPPSPTPLAAAPPPCAADYEAVEVGEEDTIELRDLMPEHGGGAADRSNSVPPRPVTAIGHRPLRGVDEADHRHVWADDPAVHIRRASDLLHDTPASEELPPEAIQQLADRPAVQGGGPAGGGGGGGGVGGERSPRHSLSSFPLPPAALGVALPRGVRTPDWVYTPWCPAGAGGAARPGAAAGSTANPDKSCGGGGGAGSRAVPGGGGGGGGGGGAGVARSGASGGGGRRGSFMLDVNAPALDNGILEQERRYSELQQLYTLWVTGRGDFDEEQRFIPHAAISKVLQQFCGWEEEELEVNNSVILSDIDSNYDGKLDWHEFYVYMTRVSRAMPPTAFDNLTSCSTESVLAAQQRQEDTRRDTLISNVFSDLDHAGTDSICTGFVKSMAEHISCDDDECGDIAQGIVHTLQGGGAARSASADQGKQPSSWGSWGSAPPGGRAAGDASMCLDEFCCIVRRAAGEAAPPSFDLFIFRLKRAAAVLLAAGAAGCASGSQRGGAGGGGGGAVLSAEDLEMVVGLSPSSSPLVIQGNSVDPSKVLTECAGTCEVQLRLFLIASDVACRAAIAALQNAGFAKGDWICASVDPKYKGADSFLRSLGVCMQTRSPWSIHRKFRLWVHVAAEASLPSVLSVRSVLLNVDNLDLPSVKHSLELQASRCSSVPL